MKFKKIKKIFFKKIKSGYITFDFPIHIPHFFQIKKEPLKREIQPTKPNPTKNHITRTKQTFIKPTYLKKKLSEQIFLLKPHYKGSNHKKVNHHQRQDC